MYRIHELATTLKYASPFHLWRCLGFGGKAKGGMCIRGEKFAVWRALFSWMVGSSLREPVGGGEVPIGFRDWLHVVDAEWSAPCSAMDIPVHEEAESQKLGWCSVCAESDNGTYVVGERFFWAIRGPGSGNGGVGGLREPLHPSEYKKDDLRGVFGTPSSEYPTGPGGR